MGARAYAQTLCIKNGDNSGNLMTTIQEIEPMVGRLRALRKASQRREKLRTRYPDREFEPTRSEAKRYEKAREFLENFDREHLNPDRTVRKHLNPRKFILVDLSLRDSYSFDDLIGATRDTVKKAYGWKSKANCIAPQKADCVGTLKMYILRTT